MGRHMPRRVYKSLRRVYSSQCFALQPVKRRVLGAAVPAHGQEGDASQAAKMLPRRFQRTRQNLMIRRLRNNYARAYAAHRLSRDDSISPQICY